jgi:hypothetical protein
MNTSDHLTLPVPRTRRSARDHAYKGRRVHCVMSYQTYQAIRKLAYTAETSFSGAIELAALEGLAVIGQKPDRDWLIVADPRIVESRRPGRKFPGRKRQ